MLHSRFDLFRLLPGLALSGLVAALAMGLEILERSLTGHPWVDALVLAIAIGTLAHTVLGLHATAVPGVEFAAKLLLEIAIVLLGASVSFSSIGEFGIELLAAVVLVVLLSVPLSYGIGRLLGLSKRLAILVACGNSICGNSAIVAAAPVVEADSNDVAASISFTAALGILVVLLLPAAVATFGLDQRQYGVVAGMTVYAVPQVLAATVPVGGLSVQVGTVVKLMRVLMLGPVILLLGLSRGAATGTRQPMYRLVPWFIVGFLMFMTAGSFGLIAEPVLAVTQHAATVLTVVSMAALGLSVNLRSVLACGGGVLAAGALSILVLASLSGLSLLWVT